MSDNAHGNPVPPEQRTRGNQQQIRPAGLHARAAETARLEREQGGQPAADSSGDPVTDATPRATTGPQDRFDEAGRRSASG